MIFKNACDDDRYKLVSTIVREKHFNIIKFQKTLENCFDYVKKNSH